SGDESALEIIYRAHGGAVKGIARRVLNDDTLAEDVVQDVFVSFWKAPDRYDPSKGSLRTYLLTIKPAPYPLSFFGQTSLRARHIHFKVAHEAARGVTTQMYFEGDPLLETDSVMRRTPEELRHLLITSPQDDPETGLPLHRFDIVLA
ncbi:MAG TPA: sigma factor, partial [Woeseiaceae bacterium]|nr:sigma factor [Woeseiaceae bacterium]